MNFQSTNEILTDVSTLPNTSPNTQTIHTYIHTYIRKREKERDSKTATVVIYNPEKFTRLQEICLRNKTNISSVISNLVDLVVDYFDEKPTTMDSYLDPNYMPTPNILDHVEEKILPFLKKQDSKTLGLLDSAFFRAHVWARVLSGLPVEKRKDLTSDYLYVWRTWYK